MKLFVSSSILRVLMIINFLMSPLYVVLILTSGAPRPYEEIGEFFSNIWDIFRKGEL